MSDRGDSRREFYQMAWMNSKLMAGSNTYNFFMDLAK